MSMKSPTSPSYSPVTTYEPDDDAYEPDATSEATTATPTVIMPIPILPVMRSKPTVQAQPNNLDAITHVTGTPSVIILPGAQDKKRKKSTTTPAESIILARPAQPSKSPISVIQDVNSVSPDTNSIFKQGVKVIDRLGEGTFGEVVSVMTKDKKMYAEKIYKMFPDLNEIDVLARMDHPNLLHSEAQYVESGTFHLVLPLAQYTMKRFIQQFGPKANPINDAYLSNVIHWMHQLISAVIFLHKQDYFHCDIKPQNILMMSSKDNPVDLKDYKAVLADFGWVYPLTYRKSKMNRICGTPGYASPQGWKQAPLKNADLPAYFVEPLDFIQSDIYALGCVFFELLTGEELNDRSPYSGYDNPLYESYKAVDAKMAAYTKNAAKLQELMPTPAVNLRKKLLQCFRCIRIMVMSNQIDRIESASAIFNEEPFASMNLPPILGKVKVVKQLKVEYPGINKFYDKLCQIGMTMFNVESTVDILVYSIFVSLLYRCLSNKSFMINPYVLVISCCTIASQLNGDHYNINDAIQIVLGSDLSRDVLPYSIHEAAYADEGDWETAVKSLIFEIIVYLQGVLRVPTIYEQAPRFDAISVLYWVAMTKIDASLNKVAPALAYARWLQYIQEHPGQIHVTDMVYTTNVKFIEFHTGGYYPRQAFDDYEHEQPADYYKIALIKPMKDGKQAVFCRLDRDTKLFTVIPYAG